MHEPNYWTKPPNRQSSTPPDHNAGTRIYPETEGLS